MRNYDVPKINDDDVVVLRVINSGQEFSSVRVLINDQVVPRLTGFIDVLNALRTVFSINPNVKVKPPEGAWFEYCEDSDEVKLCNPDQVEKPAELPTDPPADEIAPTRYLVYYDTRDANGKVVQRTSVHTGDNPEDALDFYFNYKDRLLDGIMVKNPDQIRYDDSKNIDDIRQLADKATENVWPKYSLYEFVTHYGSDQVDYSKEIHRTTNHSVAKECLKTHGKVDGFIQFNKDGTWVNNQKYDNEPAAQIKYFKSDGTPIELPNALMNGVETPG